MTPGSAAFGQHSLRLLFVFGARLLLSFLLGPKFAGAADLAARSYQVKHWTTDNGLPQSTITCLRQTRDGYLWIGTRRGLARFDGHTFKVFTDEITFSTPGDMDCRELAEDSEGRLWVRTADGIIAFEHGSFQRYSTRQGPLQGLIHEMRGSSRGGLWLSLDHQLHHFNNGILKHHPLPQLADRLDPAQPFSLGQEDREGRLWIVEGVSERIGGVPAKLNPRWTRYDPQTGQSKTLEDIIGPPPGEVHAVFADRAGRIWFSVPGRLLCWVSGTWSSYPTRPDWNEGSMGQLAQEDAAGNFWFIPSGGPVIRFHKGEFTTFGETEGVSDRDIRCAWADREGNVWIGTGVGGLDQFEPRFFRSLLTTNATGDKNEVYSVATGADGRMWFGMDSGLMLQQFDQFTTYTNARPGFGGRLHQNVAPVLEDSLGIPWFGVRPDGLESLRGGSFVSELTASDLGQSDWTITALLQDRKQRLWIGSKLGLICWRERIVARYSTQEGLSDNEVLGLLEAPDESLWIGTANGGLNRLFNGRFESYRMRDGLLADTAVPLLLEPDGSVWIGTPKGLNRIQGTQIRSVTALEGLFDGRAQSLLDDQRGSYWASGDQGVWRMKKADLQAVADGRTNWLQCLRYGAADGILSSESNGDRLPSACRAPDGRLWFPTRRGVAVVDPSQLQGDDVEPPVVIARVVADREVIWGDGIESTPDKAAFKNEAENPLRELSPTPSTPIPVALAAGHGRVLEIHYAANSFIAPEKIRFKYKLEGHDRDWIKDDNNRRIVYYPDLRPGDYTFRVTACNSHGFWNRTGASFAVSIAPHFFETRLFYGACGLVAIALAAGIQSYRLRLQRRILALEQQTALDRERARIAQDIHDDLGSRLSQLSILGELAECQLENPKSAGVHLRKMITTSKEMFLAMDEIVWAVNPKLDSLAGLISYLREYAPEFLGPAGLHCRLDLPTSAPSYALSAEARHHLFLVVKEALHNVVQHAQATEVWLRLAVVPHTLELTVEDNGCGFSWGGKTRDATPTLPKPELGNHEDPASHHPSSTAGNGLENMRHRMEEIGGRLVVETRPGHGTKLRFLLNLSP